MSPQDLYAGASGSVYTRDLYVVSIIWGINPFHPLKLLSVWNLNDVSICFALETASLKRIIGGGSGGGVSCPCVNIYSNMGMVYFRVLGALRGCGMVKGKRGKTPPGFRAIKYCALWHRCQRQPPQKSASQIGTLYTIPPSSLLRAYFFAIQQHIFRDFLRKSH